MKTSAYTIAHRIIIKNFFHQSEVHTSFPFTHNFVYKLGMGICVCNFFFFPFIQVYVCMYDHFLKNAINILSTPSTKKKGKSRIREHEVKSQDYV